MTKNLFRRIIRLILIIIAAVWLLFEDWVWDSIVKIIKKVNIIKSFEDYLSRQNQYFLLTLFIFPFLIMIPAKIYGLYLIANGKIMMGVTIFIMAKITITALVTRLYIISKDKLLEIKTFARFYYWFDEKKEWLYTELNKLPAIQTAKEKIIEIKHFLKKIKNDYKRDKS
ncbi:MAG: hypothetical protein HQK91_03560 [Nitrospirae bacterium]|nr:hypothetical protein [Nitrospirota bacterium]MBF0540513.1 hypothetical protein [Nitrospirota bacterium]